MNMIIKQLGTCLEHDNESTFEGAKTMAYPHFCLPAGTRVQQKTATGEGALELP
jgi:hypothetical protein